MLGVAYQSADGTWHRDHAGSVDTIARTITAQISHFSNWRAYQGYHLSVTNHRVLTGEAASSIVSIEYSAPPIGGGDDTDETVVPGRDFVDNLWFVNGVSNGDASTGTLTPVLAGSAAMWYNSPESVPSPDPVNIQGTIIWSGVHLPLYATIAVVAKNWKLSKELWIGWQCLQNNVASYELHSLATATFSLDHNFQPTNIVTNDGGCDVTVPAGSCMAGYVVSSFKAGLGCRWTSFQPTLSADGQMFTINWGMKDTQKPQLVVTVGQSTNVINQSIGESGNSGGPTPYPMQTAPTVRSFSNKQGSAGYQSWIYTFGPQ